MRYRTGLVLSSVLAMTLLGCSSNEHAVVGILERNRLALRAPASEPVTQWHVAEGEQVSAGQVLVSLDPSHAQAQLARAQAELARAEARLAELIRGPRSESILQARATVSEAQAQLDQAQEEYRRVKTLVAQSLLPQAQLDQAQASKNTSAARLQAARAKLAAQLEGTTIEQLDQARASVAAAKAQVEAVQIALDRLTIRAPVAGQVEALPYRVGERPPAGAPAAILLAAKPVYARVYIPQNLRGQLQPGTDAIIHFAGSDKTLPGVIHYLASDAAYTPYFALTEYDRGRLSYLAEIHVVPNEQDDQRETTNLPTGIPITVTFPELDGQTDE